MSNPCWVKISGHCYNLNSYTRIAMVSNCLRLYKPSMQGNYEAYDDERIDERDFNRILNYLQQCNGIHFLDIDKREGTK